MLDEGSSRLPPRIGRGSPGARRLRQQLQPRPRRRRAAGFATLCRSHRAAAGDAEVEHRVAGQERRRDRRSRRPDRLQTRKLGKRLRRRTRLRQGSKALAGRKGRPLLRALRRQQFQPLWRRRADHRRGRDAGFHRQAGQVKPRTRQGRLLRRGQLQGPGLRRHLDRGGRELPGHRRRRTGLQGRGQRVQGRIAGRRQLLQERRRRQAR